MNRASTLDLSHRTITHLAAPKAALQPRTGHWTTLAVAMLAFTLLGGLLLNLSHSTDRDPRTTGETQLLGAPLTTTPGPPGTADIQTHIQHKVHLIQST